MPRKLRLVLYAMHESAPRTLCCLLYNSSLMTFHTLSSSASPTSSSASASRSHVHQVPFPSTTQPPLLTSPTFPSTSHVAHMFDMPSTRDPPSTSTTSLRPHSPSSLATPNLLFDHTHSSSTSPTSRPTLMARRLRGVLYITRNLNANARETPRSMISVTQPRT